MSVSEVRVGIRCDAGPRIGVGHLMRCVALAEELTRRGVGVRFLSDLGGLSWARRQLTSRGFDVEPAPGTPAELLRTAERRRLDAMVLDSYELPAATGATLRGSGRTVLAIVDGDLRGQQADIYLDQNLDADLAAPPLPAGAVRLAGIDFALLRGAVRLLRPARPRVADAGRTPRVVCFFGGTDAYRAAPVIARLLAGTGAPFDATVVAADDALRVEVLAVARGAGQNIDVVAPTDELPTLLAGADLAVSASGTSTWELLCLGVPAALVWVVDNQIDGYGRTVRRRLAAGLGHLPSLVPASGAWQQATEVLRALLTAPDARAGLADRGWCTVDGAGVERVADELLARCAPTGPASCSAEAFFSHCAD